MPNAVIPTIPRTNLATGVSTVPPAVSLATGELATNKFLGRAYIKNEAGLVVDVAPLKTVNAKTPDGTGNATLTAADVSAVALSAVGVASGVASLDGAGKVPTSQLPASVLGSMNYQGTWNATTNSPALVSGTGTKGFFYKVGVAGSVTIDTINNWYIGDVIAFDGTTWDKFDGVSSEVLKINNVLPGTGGNVTLVASDVGAVPATDKGIANGVGTLDGTGKAPAGQMPIATVSAVGAVKIGSGLTVDAAGVLTATAQALAIASGSVLGGIKVGASLVIDGAGVLDVGTTVLTTDMTITGGTY